MIKILVDALGGDNAPSAIVQGAIEALNCDREISLVITGGEDVVKAELAKYKYDESRVETVDLPDAIDMNDNPTEAVKRKQSSLMGGYWMLKKQDDINALVTAGSTGATIVGGQLILGRIRGIMRPALCPAIPNHRGGVTLLCDCGANAECKPVMLCQFALLASAYARAGFGIKNPKVGLLSNGTEEHKGDPMHRETFKYLSQMKGINFAGNVEGRDIMMGDCDVVVCDGFSGNVALKAIEGCGKLVVNNLKTAFTSSLGGKIGYLFARKGIKQMRSKLDFDKYGGALLLGLKKVVIKSHGSSKPQSIKAAVLTAADIYRGGLIKQVESMLSEVDFSALVPEET